MKIANSELYVLEVLWAESPLTVGQVVERVKAQMDWHDNTVKTLLGRLHRKQAVERYRDGGRYFYRPAIEKRQVITSEAEGLLERFFGGRMHHLIAHFADQQRLSAKDIEEMEAILERLKSDGE